MIITLRNYLVSPCTHFTGRSKVDELINTKAKPMNNKKSRLNVEGDQGSMKLMAEAVKQPRQAQ